MMREDKPGHKEVNCVVQFPREVQHGTGVEAGSCTNPEHHLEGIKVGVGEGALLEAWGDCIAEEEAKEHEHANTM